MAGNKKLNYKGSLETFMKNCFPLENVNNGGLKFISELLNDVNSLLVSDIEKQYGATSRVNGKNFHHYARKAVEQNFPQEMKSNALSEAYKQLALLESGCLVYGDEAKQIRGRVEAKRETPEGIANQKMEATINLFKMGIRKIFSKMYPNFKVYKGDLGPLALGIHGFGKMLAEKASEKADQNKELQPIDLKRVLPEYLENKALRVALSESNRCLALYENGLIEFKAKKTYGSEWSQEDIVSEKIFAKVFKPGIQSLAKETVPGCEADVKTQKYLGHILMDIARYVAENTSETCRKERISEMKGGEVHRSVGETFPRELKQHAQLKGSKDIMEFESEIAFRETQLETEESEIKSEKVAPKSAPVKQRKQTRGKKSSPKGRKSSPTARKRKSTSSPKSSPKPRRKKSPSARSTSSPKRSPKSKRKKTISPSKKKGMSKEVVKKMKVAREEMSKRAKAQHRLNVPLEKEAESSMNDVLEKIRNRLIDMSVTKAARSEELDIENIDAALTDIFPAELAIHALIVAYNAVSLFCEKKAIG